MIHNVLGVALPVRRLYFLRLNLARHSALGDRGWQWRISEARNRFFEAAIVQPHHKSDHIMRLSIVERVTVTAKPPIRLHMETLCSAALGTRARQFCGGFAAQGSVTSGILAQVDILLNRG